MLNAYQILTLMGISGIGRKSVLHVWENTKSQDSNTIDLYDAIDATRDKYGRIRLPSAEELNNAMRKADRSLEAMDDQGIYCHALGSPDYPQSLNLLSDKPVIVYSRGNIQCLGNMQAVAVIGTREPTNYGIERANRLGRLLAEKQFIVVSGLAIGCDTAGHRGCLEAGGKTVAVLATGLDQIYPSQNRNLAEEIVESGGCLISEYPIGTPITKGNFIERDRLQSGLSTGVIVIETDIKGGTMHTVGFAQEQNKILACLRHPANLIGHPKTMGNQWLLETIKAMPLSTQDDFMSFVAAVHAVGQKRTEMRIYEELTLNLKRNDFGHGKEAKAEPPLGAPITNGILTPSKPPAKKVRRNSKEKNEEQPLLLNDQTSSQKKPKAPKAKKPLIAKTSSGNESPTSAMARKDTLF